MKETLHRLAMTAIPAFLIFISVPVFALDTDARIESSVKQTYVFRTFLKGDDINVRSRNGIVTLTGSVSVESSKALARETVVNLPGVVSVDNRLAVKDEAPAEDTDAWLVANVKSALLFHRNVNATETEVLSTEGVVTLRGEAVSLAQKDMVTEYAWDVQGVKDVKNEMTVANDAMKRGNTTMGEKVDVLSDSIDDASITALVKATLMYHRSTSARNTTVNTKAGVVYLGGEARNAAEEDLASKFVSDVHGVRRVVNNMSLEGN